MRQPLQVGLVSNSTEIPAAACRMGSQTVETQQKGPRGGVLVFLIGCTFVCYTYTDLHAWDLITSLRPAQRSSCVECEGWTMLFITCSPVLASQHGHKPLSFRCADLVSLLVQDLIYLEVVCGSYFSSVLHTSNCWKDVPGTTLWTVAALGIAFLQSSRTLKSCFGTVVMKLL